jgi:hypothetical protein
MRSKNLYVFLSGGLGNQLHSLAAGFSLAAKHNLNLVILSTKPRSKNRRSRELDIFNLQFDSLKNVQIRFIAATGFSKINWSVRKILLRTAAQFGIVSTIRTSEEIKENLVGTKLPRKRSVLDGHFENSEFPVLAKSLGFKVPLELNMKSREFLEFEKYLSSGDRPFVIAVHIRLGDFRTWHNGEFLLEAEYYIKRISLMRVQQPDSQIWLFSDEPIESQKMLGGFSGDIRNISANHNLNNAEEMRLLSLSDALICSRSTFSWWAAFWSQNQNSIFYPDGGSCLTGWRDLDLQVHT